MTFTFTAEWFSAIGAGLFSLIGAVLYFDRRLTRVEVDLKNVVSGISEIKEML